VHLFSERKLEDRLTEVDIEGIWGDADASRNVGLDFCDFGLVSENDNPNAHSVQDAGDNRTNHISSAGAGINCMYGGLRGGQFPWSSGVGAWTSISWRTVNQGSGALGLDPGGNRVGIDIT
jgi:hypothetical protein